MNKKLKIGLLSVGGLLVAIQLVPYGRDHENPPVVVEPAWNSPETRALAKRACFDCHSHETTWPWYASVAPASWIVQNHVEEGREHLNFSDWSKPSRHADEAAHEVEEGEMPMTGYVPLHSEADLSPEEKQKLVDGLVAMFGRKQEEK